MALDEIWSAKRSDPTHEGQVYLEVLGGTGLHYAAHSLHSASLQCGAYCSVVSVLAVATEQLGFSGKGSCRLLATPGGAYLQPTPRKDS